MRTSQQVQRGFTLVEVLIAMVLMTLLMTLLGSSMSRIIIGNQALQANILGYRDFVSLRRTLHRDLQNMRDRTTLRFNVDGFSFTTSHCLVRNHPMQVRVTWTINENVTRKEEIDDLKYSRELVLFEGVDSFSLEVWEDRDDRWMDLDTILLNVAAEEFSEYYRNIRLTLNAKGVTVPILERLPHGEL